MSSSQEIINLNQGDPTLFEPFWQRMAEKSEFVIPGSQSLSYFSASNNLCWFMEPEFEKEVRRLHELVDNANTKDRYIIVGTGSTQLYQAALYALSTPIGSEPLDVVAALPYYSFYPLNTDFLRSNLYRWAGDALTYNKEGPYIEVITSPNNPDGSIREAVVKHEGGRRIHDLAYYWPHYTPITSKLDEDIMLFTTSKCSGHAGIRIGWAVVRDIEIAKKMSRFIEINTIGVSKDSQLRAAKILRTISDTCEESSDNFFDFAASVMADRWKRLREVISHASLKFHLPQFPENVCNFKRSISQSHPGFAWMYSEDIENLEVFFNKHNILTRSGIHFGVEPKYSRVSLLEKEEKFNAFLQRLGQM